MTLRLVIEHSPHRQPQSEVSHVGGDLTIGRGVEADWRLEDPDMFISRKHCIVSGGEGEFRVTDISRGGVFIDGATAPLGEGRSADLTHGMRLRLGDVVLRIELESAPVARPVSPQAPERVAPPAAPRLTSAASPAAPEPASNPFAADDFFRQPAVHAPPPPPRPASLPDPFDAPARPAFAPPTEPRPSTDAPLFDDPFTLDPLPSRPAGEPQPTRETVPGGGFDDFFGTVPSAPPSPRQPVPAPAPPPVSPSSAPPPAAPAPPAKAPAQVSTSVPTDSGAGDLKAALLKGMGLPPELVTELSVEDLEAVGRRTRALLEALVHLLRARAREKQNLRVAQTVIGGADVNPLKFLATTDEMMATLIGEARPGYLDADAAIAGAVRDLADHQVRTWSGLQESLRRMIDRFDPEAIEAEFEEAGRLKAILAGGRSALLWQLYRERYRIIARAAEDRFLGDVGSDFRDAYEGTKGRNSDD